MLFTALREGSREGTSLKGDRGERTNDSDAQCIRGWYKQAGGERAVEVERAKPMLAGGDWRANAHTSAHSKHTHYISMWVGEWEVLAAIVLLGLVRGIIDE